MSSSKSHESDVDELRQFFLGLDSTFVPLKGTTEQQKQCEDQNLARRIWVSTLAQHRANQPLAKKRARRAKEAPPIEPFRFLNLPRVLRNRVYEYYLIDTASGGMNDLNRYFGKRGASFYDPGYSGMTVRRSPTPNFYYYEDLQLRTGVDVVGKRVMESEYRDYKLSLDAQQAYMGYKAAYQVSKGNICHHFHRNPERIRITERGNACEDFPFLAHTCRQILGEMWNLLPARKGTKHEDKEFEQRRRYQGEVTNFDFFPLHRFLQMLRRLPTGTDVKGAMVDRFFKESSEQATYVCRHRNIRRFITKHWLEHVPIWGCMTGLRDWPDTSDWRRTYLETKIAGQIKTWFYRVRQVVALHRIRKDLWQETTIPYNKRMDEIDGGATDWDFIPEEQLISETIDMLSVAVLYQCGHFGKWKNQAWLKSGDRKEREFRLDKNDIACEKKHALVHLAEQYCARVDRLLREVLGDFYSEWEGLEDQRLVPRDVLF